MLELLRIKQYHTHSFKQTVSIAISKYFGIYVTRLLRIVVGIPNDFRSSPHSDEILEAKFSMVALLHLVVLCT